jgi:hypothetical protein
MNLRANTIAVSLLRYTYAVFLLVMSVDKLVQVRFIDNWDKFIGPAVHALLPISNGAIVSFEGIVELGIIVLLLTKWFRIGILILIVAIIPVWIDLMILGFYDFALHDFVISMGAVVLFIISAPLKAGYPAKLRGRTA